MRLAVSSKCASQNFAPLGAMPTPMPLKGSFSSFAPLQRVRRKTRIETYALK
jgi:hypothetical protein